MFKRRLFSSSILISVILVSLISDYKYKFYLSDITISLFSSIGLYEFYTMLENKLIKPYEYFGIVMGLAIPLSLIFRFELTKKWELFFVVLALLFIILMQFRRRQNSGVIVDISTTLFGILYVSWFFSFLIKLKYFNASGIGFLSTCLLITKLGDIGGYIVGSTFGKHPLLPLVSPKKSIEGSLGGLIFSILGALASRPLIHFTSFHLVVIGLLLGIMGQLGDLSESLIKRDCQVKDSGNIFPGLGGMLDSIDSLLFTAPIFYFYLSAILK
ncbi:MAG: phosphatidate cytidylyltransferase [Candidatus Omnitrophica bacterium]|nr:phosphatidate cytidylyltransferase [Candidatus Omnitrophota bacterium]